MVPDSQTVRTTRTTFYERVYACVRQVPAGKVVTYGQVAVLLGQPRSARAVGYALRLVPSGLDIPWHRVLNHRGQISPRYPAEGPLLQRLLLEDEGVCFDAQARVNLAVYRWQPTWGTEGGQRWDSQPSEIIVGPNTASWDTIWRQRLIYLWLLSHERVALPCMVCGTTEPSPVERHGISPYNNHISR